jgi:hypothetical protein
VATRTAQEAEVLTPQQALAFVERHGIVCEASHRGEIPSLVDAIAGETVRGNWWAHPKARMIFALTRAVRDARDVLVCRLVDGKITFIHERLWPALVRMADQFPGKHLSRVREVHSTGGKHIIEETPFPAWVPASVLSGSKRLNESDGQQAMQSLLGR